MSVIKHEGPAIHNRKIEGYRYVGSVESVFDDTPQGMDDLYVGEPFIPYKKCISLLRVWGELQVTVASYKTDNWTAVNDKKIESDPFFSVVRLRAIELGYLPAPVKQGGDT